MVDSIGPHGRDEHPKLLFDQGCRQPRRWWRLGVLGTVEAQDGVEVDEAASLDLGHFQVVDAGLAYEVVPRDPADRSHAT